MHNNDGDSALHKIHDACFSMKHAIVAGYQEVLRLDHNGHQDASHAV
jgi:hypothetical protein